MPRLFSTTWIASHISSKEYRLTGESFVAVASTEVMMKSSWSSKVVDEKRSESRESSETVESPAQLSEAQVNAYKKQTAHMSAQLEISPLIEFLGYVKDHRLPMKMHWISSKKELGADDLKGSLQALFESELVMGSLLLGIVFAGLTDLSSDNTTKAWDELDYTQLDFWWSLFGAIGAMATLMFVLISYINSIFLSPISSANFYAFAITRVGLTVLNLPSNFMIIGLYFNAFFVLTSLIKILGESLQAYIFVLAPTGVVFGYGIYVLTVAMNLSVKAGLYSECPLIDPDTLYKLSPPEINNVVFQRALQLERQGCFKEVLFNEDLERVDRLYSAGGPFRPAGVKGHLEERHRRNSSVGHFDLREHTAIHKLGMGAGSAVTRHAVLAKAEERGDEMC